jgi:hypothetical protein
MAPLHYAAYFGCPAVLDVLLRSRSVSGDVSVALHLAACHAHHP